MLESLIIFFAALIHGALGLGFPMTSTPLLANTGSLMRAIQLTLIPTLGVNVLMLIKASQPFKKLRPYLAIIPAICVGTLIGSYLLLHFNPEPFRFLLASVILLFLWLDYRDQFTQHNSDAHPKGTLLAGLLTGILVGTVNAGVPILIIFAIYNRLDRWQSVVLFNSCFLTGKLTQLALFGKLNVLNPQWQQFGLGLLLIAIMGVLIGQQLGQHINQARWRAAMRWVLFAIALSLFYRLYSPL